MRGEPLEPWFVTGLVDGEGSFTFSRSGASVGLYFAVKLTAADRELMERLQEFFGVGKLYEVKARAPGPRSGYTKAAVYYRVTRLESLAVVIGHFERFPLQGIKRRAFAAWKELVEWKRANFRRAGGAELERLVDGLASVQLRRRASAHQRHG